MLLSLENVQKNYGTFSLDVSLQVEKGQVIGLIGANGAGKSTTFKTILGLIQVESGVCKVLDKAPETLTSSEKEKIGVVLSDSGFSVYLTVKDVADIMAGMYKRFSKKEFEESCKRFKIPLDKKIKEFSTGMKAKLKVLLALSHEAELLILDEPTSGLDVVAREAVLDILREYMENDKRGILISSHISSDLEGLCDMLYMIDNGRIVLKEETDVLLSEYGVLKVTPEQYKMLDKQYILKVKKEKMCYRCLTTKKRFYSEMDQDIVIENGSIDDLVMLMICGEEV